MADMCLSASLGIRQGAPKVTPCFCVRSSHGVSTLGGLLVTWDCRRGSQRGSSRSDVQTDCAEELYFYYETFACCEDTGCRNRGKPAYTVNNTFSAYVWPTTWYQSNSAACPNRPSCVECSHVRAWLRQAEEGLDSAPLLAPSRRATSAASASAASDQPTAPVTVPPGLRPTFCRKCNGLRPPRAHHCAICARWGDQQRLQSPCSDVAWRSDREP